MKNLYEFVMELYSKHGDGMDLDVFIKKFMNDTFAVNSIHEAFVDDDFLGCFEMGCKIDHENKKIELLFKEN